VQIISQRCNEKATCNCGVGVRSGDTVFFVDRCRKNSFVQKHCKGQYRWRSQVALTTVYFDYCCISAARETYESLFSNHNQW